MSYFFGYCLQTLWLTGNVLTLTADFTCRHLMLQVSRHVPAATPAGVAKGCARGLSPSRHLWTQDTELCPVSHNTATRMNTLISFTPNQLCSMNNGQRHISEESHQRVWDCNLQNRSQKCPSGLKFKGHGNNQTVNSSFLNVRSAEKHAVEISDLIIRDNLDFFAMTETWLLGSDAPMLSRSTLKI